MQIKSRNPFRVTRFILLRLPYISKFLTKLRPDKKRLLIIKTDAIGDYILFRNFIEVVKLSDEFKDYQVDLLGNALWRDIALKYDKQFINEFYFISPLQLYESPLKTLKLGWRLFKNNYHIVLQPSFTRHLITDGLAALTAAKQIIGFEGDNESIDHRYKIKTNRFYTRKLLLAQGAYFEFERSKFFFESVLGFEIPINSPLIPINKINRNGIVIFPGAGVLKRAWEKEKFLALINLISGQINQPVYLAGSGNEVQIGDYLLENLPPGMVINLIGKTSLPEMIALVGNACLVIANETSAIHITAATQTKAICILGGGHFGRFAPYPDHLENQPVCLYEKMECFNCNWNCKFRTADSGPYPCISAISVEQVWQMVTELLPAWSNATYNSN